MLTLTNLKIQNFRLLKDVEIQQLGRVNLIVGKNNAGKSSVLEALRIYEALGSPLLLETLLKEHDEMEGVTSGEGVLSVENFFTNRTLPPPGENIYIGNMEHTEYVSLKPVYFTLGTGDKDQEGSFFRRRVRTELDPSELTSFEEVRQALKINSKNRQLEPPAIRSRLELPGVLQVWLDFQSYDRDNYKLGQLELQKMGLDLSSCYVPVDFIPTRRLADIWDDIYLTYGQPVIDGLKLIDSEVEGLTFKKVAGDMEGERKPFVKRKGQDRLEPLKSYGDGMRRVLQLFLYLIKAKGRLLLIDEFENGLHYEAQYQIWELLFTLAKALNVQVFATTHSDDCIDAFHRVSVSEENEEEAILFRLGRSARTSNKGQVIARIYDKQSLQTVMQANLGVR